MGKLGARRSPKNILELTPFEQAVWELSQEFPEMTCSDIARGLGFSPHAMHHALACARDKMLIKDLEAKQKGRGRKTMLKKARGQWGSGPGFIDQ